MVERKKLTKREELRIQRRREQMRSRLIIFGIIGAIVLGFFAVVILPTIIQNINEANTPIGSINEITPLERANVDGTAMGDPAAPVRIDIYEDFQCPACARYSEAVENQVVTEYVNTGKVYYVFNHYPFLDDNSFTKESDQSANASMCAGEQGRFWDYHDMLYANQSGENQSAFSDRRLVAFAETLGLDMDAFNACFEENRYQDEINEDIASGRALGVNSTPSVFVNGQLISPDRVPSYEELKAAIEAQLTQ